MISPNDTEADGPPPPKRPDAVKIRMPKPGTYLIIHTNGTSTLVDQKPEIGQVKKDMSAKGIDTVNLKFPEPGWVMMVDDTGMIEERPVNPIATALYHANCVPGTTHKIHGDVAIVWDEDFA